MIFMIPEGYFDNLNIRRIPTIGKAGSYKCETHKSKSDKAIEDFKKRYINYYKKRGSK